MIKKRATVSILIMVMLTLVLFTYLLFSLNTNTSKISGDFELVKEVASVYSEKQGNENTVYFKLIKSFIDSYQRELSLNEDKFGINPDFDFNQDFLFLVNASFRKMNFEGIESNRVVGKIFNGSILSFDGDSVLVTNKFVIRREARVANKNGILESALDSNVSLGFDKLELYSFDEIRRVYENCTAINNQLSVKIAIKNCFKNNLKNFNFEVDMKNDPTSKTKKIGKIDATSKSKYFIDNKMENIRFVLKFDASDKADIDSLIP